jgi:hypothetical protein
MCAIPNNL